MPTPSKSLPPAWVDRLFARFAAAYGSMKVGTMYPADQVEEVRELWAQQLGRFAPESIGLAVQAVIDGGREWPPTLPEFVEQCRRCALSRVAHAPAVMLPAPNLEPEIIAARLREIEDLTGVAKPKPGREWAHKIVSRAEAGEPVPYAVDRMALNAIGAKVEPE